MSALVPRWSEAASSAGPVIPWLAVAVAGRSQTAYREFLDHAQGCADCEALKGRCEVAEELWTAYRVARA